MSAGERTPSSRRTGESGRLRGLSDSRRVDFIICAFGFIDIFGPNSRFWCGLEILNYRLSCAVASYDFDLLLGLGKPFLANFHQIHSFFVAHDEIFKRRACRIPSARQFFRADPFAPSKLSSASRAFGLLLMGETEELSTG